MASRRVAARSAASLLSVRPQIRATFAAYRPATRTVGQPIACKFHTTPIQRHTNPSKSKKYEFADIKSFVEHPSPERILVDVREPYEYQEGYIPGAINVPIKTAADAFFMPADEFEDKFGFPKPKVDQEVVFYCKAGVRGSAAAQLAERIGYEKIGEYRGSMLDWERQGGQITK